MSLKWDSPEMKRIIKSLIRRSFRRSPQFIECLKRVRHELPPPPLKNGQPSRKKSVRYQCEVCKELFQQKYTQVDHIEVAIPLDREEIDLSYDEMVQSICCGIENLQAICSTPMKDNNGNPSCHRLKTNKENFIRRHIKEMKRNNTFTGITPLLLQELDVEYEKYLHDLNIEKEKKRQRYLKKYGLDV